MYKKVKAFKNNSLKKFSILATVALVASFAMTGNSKKDSGSSSTFAMYEFGRRPLDFFVNNDIFNNNFGYNYGYNILNLSNRSKLFGLIDDDLGKVDDALIKTEVKDLAAIGNIVGKNLKLESIVGSVLGFSLDFAKSSNDSSLYGVIVKTVSSWNEYKDLMNLATKLHNGNLDHSRSDIFKCLGIALTNLQDRFFKSLVNIIHILERKQHDSEEKSKVESKFLEKYDFEGLERVCNFNSILGNKGLVGQAKKMHGAAVEAFKKSNVVHYINAKAASSASGTEISSSPELVKLDFLFRVLINASAIINQTMIQVNSFLYMRGILTIFKECASEEGKFYKAFVNMFDAGDLKLHFDLIIPLFFAAIRGNIKDGAQMDELFNGVTNALKGNVAQIQPFVFFGLFQQLLRTVCGDLYNTDVFDVSSGSAVADFDGTKRLGTRNFADLVNVMLSLIGYFAKSNSQSNILGVTLSEIKNASAWFNNALGALSVYSSMMYSLRANNYIGKVSNLDAGKLYKTTDLDSLVDSEKFRYDLDKRLGRVYFGNGLYGYREGSLDFSNLSDESTFDSSNKSTLDDSVVLPVSGRKAISLFGILRNIFDSENHSFFMRKIVELDKQYSQNVLFCLGRVFSHSNDLNYKFWPGSVASEKRTYFNKFGKFLNKSRKRIKFFPKDLEKSTKNFNTFDDDYDDDNDNDNNEKNTNLYKSQKNENNNNFEYLDNQEIPLPPNVLSAVSKYLKKDITAEALKSDKNLRAVVMRLARIFHCFALGEDSGCTLAALGFNNKDNLMSNNSSQIKDIESYNYFSEIPVDEFQNIFQNLLSYYFQQTANEYSEDPKTKQLLLDLKSLGSFRLEKDNVLKFPQIRSFGHSEGKQIEFKGDKLEGEEIGLLQNALFFVDKNGNIVASNAVVDALIAGGLRFIESSLGYVSDYFDTFSKKIDSFMRDSKDYIYRGYYDNSYLRKNLSNKNSDSSSDFFQDGYVISFGNVENNLFTKDVPFGKAWGNFFGDYAFGKTFFNKPALKNAINADFGLMSYFLSSDINSLGHYVYSNKFLKKDDFVFRLFDVDFLRDACLKRLEKFNKLEKIASDQEKDFEKELSKVKEVVKNKKDKSLRDWKGLTYEGAFDGKNVLLSSVKEPVVVLNSKAGLIQCFVDEKASNDTYLVYAANEEISPTKPDVVKRVAKSLGEFKADNGQLNIGVPIGAGEACFKKGQNEIHIYKKGKTDKENAFVYKMKFYLNDDSEKDAKESSVKQLKILKTENDRKFLGKESDLSVTYNEKTHEYIYSIPVNKDVVKSDKLLVAFLKEDEDPKKIDHDHILYELTIPEDGILVFKSMAPTTTKDMGLHFYLADRGVLLSESYLGKATVNYNKTEDKKVDKNKSGKKRFDHQFFMKRKAKDNSSNSSTKAETKEMKFNVALPRYDYKFDFDNVKVKIYDEATNELIEEVDASVKRTDENYNFGSKAVFEFSFEAPIGEEDRNVFVTFDLKLNKNDYDEDVVSDYVTLKSEGVSYKSLLNNPSLRFSNNFFNNLNFLN